MSVKISIIVPDMSGEHVAEIAKDIGDVIVKHGYGNDPESLVDLTDPLSIMFKSLIIIEDVEGNDLKIEGEAVVAVPVNEVEDGN